MADLTITRGNTLPNSSQKADFHNLIDLATGSVSNIVDADVNSAAAISSSKLDLSAIAQNLVMSSKILKLAKGADVASVAGAITLGDDGNYFDITGTNAITSITAKTAGTVVTLQFDSTASLVDGSNLKLQGNFQGAAETQISLVCDGTNWFEVSRNNSSYTPSASNALAGSVVQTVNTQTSAVASGTTTIPNDDTIPQNTEGDEYITRAITPASATNKLLITITANLGGSANGFITTGALFQDSTANALACGRVLISDSPNPTCFVLQYFMTAGTTSSTTFKFRAGGTTGTLTLNGQGGSRLNGGVLYSGITIQEIKA
jgi:hypothetical protein